MLGGDQSRGRGGRGPDKGEGHTGTPDAAYLQEDEPSSDTTVTESPSWTALLAVAHAYPGDPVDGTIPDHTGSCRQHCALWSLHGQRALLSPSPGVYKLENRGLGAQGHCPQAMILYMVQGSRDVFHRKLNMIQVSTDTAQARAPVSCRRDPGKATAPVSVTGAGRPCLPAVPCGSHRTVSGDRASSEQTTPSGHLRWEPLEALLANCRHEEGRDAVLLGHCPAGVAAAGGL